MAYGSNLALLLWPMSYGFFNFWMSFTIQKKNNILWYENYMINSHAHKESFIGTQAYRFTDVLSITATMAEFSSC